MISCQWYMCSQSPFRALRNGLKREIEVIMKEIKIDFPDADKFLENLEKSMDEYRKKILECAREGKPMPKPYFRARRKDFTKVYECNEYKCDAHPRGCFFCKHSTDVWWDFTTGPYMIICELQKENDQDMPTFGCCGECKHFEE